MAGRAQTRQEAGRRARAASVRARPGRTAGAARPAAGQGLAGSAAREVTPAGKGGGPGCLGRGARTTAGTLPGGKEGAGGDDVPTIVDHPPRDRRFVAASLAYVLACTYLATFLWAARAFLPGALAVVVLALWPPIIFLFLSTLFVRYAIDGSHLVVWYGPLRLSVPRGDIASVEAVRGPPDYVRAYSGGVLYLATGLRGRIVVRRSRGWPRAIVISPSDPRPFLDLGEA